MAFHAADGNHVGARPARILYPQTAYPHGGSYLVVTRPRANLGTLRATADGSRYGYSGVGYI